MVPHGGPPNSALDNNLVCPCDASKRSIRLADSEVEGAPYHVSPLAAGGEGMRAQWVKKPGL